MGAQRKLKINCITNLILFKNCHSAALSHKTNYWDNNHIDRYLENGKLEFKYVDVDLATICQPHTRHRRALIRNRKGNLNANCLEVIKTVACTFCWPWLGQEERHCIILCVRLERCWSWSACCLGVGEAMQMGCVCPCRCSSVAVTNVDCSTFRLHKFNWPDLTWQRTRVQCFGYSNVCIIKTNSPTAPHNNATFSFDSSTKSQPVPGLILTPIVLPHILLPDTFALGCKGFDSPSSFFFLVLYLACKQVPIPVPLPSSVPISHYPAAHWQIS